MSEPLKPVSSGQDKPQSHIAPSQNEAMDELARKIAEENDARARQRFDEVVSPQKYYSAEKKRAMNWGILVCVLIIVAVIVFAFNSHH